MVYFCKLSHLTLADLAVQMENKAFAQALVYRNKKVKLLYHLELLLFMNICTMKLAALKQSLCRSDNGIP